MWADQPCGSFTLHKADGGCLIRGSPGVEHSRWPHHTCGASGDSQKAASTRTLRVISESPPLYRDLFYGSSGYPKHRRRPLGLLRASKDLGPEMTITARDLSQLHCSHCSQPSFIAGGDNSRASVPKAIFGSSSSQCLRSQNKPQFPLKKMTSV